MISTTSPVHLWRMRTRVVGVTGIGLVVAVWLGLEWWFGLRGLTGYRLDLDVYRIGGSVWLDGGLLYGELPALRIGGDLPFTYPPIAAVVLAPFAVVPFEVASLAMVVLTVGALAVVVVTVLRSLNVSPWPAAAAVLAVVLMLEPVRETLGFGQVNAVLMALVVLDTLTRTPRWPRGALIGLAAAIKLTPAVFVLFFLLRGDRRAALTSVVSFGVVTAVGFLLSWQNSVQYWTSTVFDSGRIGAPHARSNQSITALLARFGVESTVLWLTLAALVMVATMVAMWRAFAAGRPTWALSLNALGALVVSPVSWSHHWVWAVVVLLVAGVGFWRRPTVASFWLAGGGVALFVLSPHWWWERDDPWTAWRWISGHGYLIFAVLVVLVSAAGVWRDHRDNGQIKTTNNYIDVR